MSPARQPRWHVVRQRQQGRGRGIQTQAAIMEHGSHMALATVDTTIIQMQHSCGHSIHLGVAFTSAWDSRGKTEKSQPAQASIEHTDLRVQIQGCAVVT